MNDQQLTQRIRSASEAIVMSDSTQARQLEAIAATLAEDEVTSIDSTRTRRRVVASIIAAAMIAPAGLAAASETSVPGDPLYPVKQLSEKVLVLFDEDVIARHRVEEIESLEDRGTNDPSLVESARLALSALGSDHALWQRLEASTAEVEIDEDESQSETSLPGISDDEGSDDPDESPAETENVTVGLPDGSWATITVEEDIVDVVTPPGWTVTEVDGNRARIANGTIEVEIELLEDGSVRVRQVGARDGEDEASRDDQLRSVDGSGSGPSLSNDERDRDDETPRSDDDEPDDDEGSGDS